MTDYEKIRQESARINEKVESLNMEAIEDEVVKELMYLSFAVATRCEDCIAYHVKVYKEAGGTRDQLGSLYQISIHMQGGPGGAYAGKVIDAFDQLED